MAKPSSAKNKSKVTRISAKDDAVSAQKAPTETKKPAKAAKAASAKPKQTQETSKKRFRNPLGPLVRYIKGSWSELQQVRWPDRRSTWKMTGALLAFTLFFVFVIVFIDFGFSELFKLLMGK